VRRLHLDEIDELPVLSGELRWRPLRHELGVDAFGINAYRGAEPGELVVEEHEDEHQELYVVLRGRARFRSGTEQVDAPAGTFLLFGPDEHRVAHAVEGDTVVLAIGAEARRFQPSAWEYSFRARGLEALGRLDEARHAVEQGLATYPDRGDLLFARAALEEGRGDRTAAVATLREAVRLLPESLRWARADDRLRAVAAELEAGS
jgi:tetratricopeptide (TPR) repeat protein